MQVSAFRGYKVVTVACGSKDAQTLAVTDNDQVWSWGDGDFGKLGRGGHEGCHVPKVIDSLNGTQIVQVNRIIFVQRVGIFLVLFFSNKSETNAMRVKTQFNLVLNTHP